MHFTEIIEQSRRGLLYTEDYQVEARIVISFVLAFFFVICTANPFFPFTDLGEREIMSSSFFMAVDVLYLCCSFYWAGLTLLMLPKLPFVHLPTDESLDLFFSECFPIIVYILSLHVDEVVAFVDRVLLRPPSLILLSAYFLYRVFLFHL